MISKINVLQSATIFADKGKAFLKWSDTIDKTRFVMDDLLENTNLPEGSDIADLYLENMRLEKHK